MPADGESAVIRCVDGYVPADDGNVGCWDLSGCGSVSDPFEVKFVWEGDTCLHATLPGIRHSFSLAGDTVLRRHSETHFISFDYPAPMAEAVLAQRSATVSRYTSQGRAFQSEYFACEGVVSIAPAVTGTLILPQGDTIASVSLTVRRCREVIAFDGRCIPRRADILCDSCGNRLTRHTDTYTWRSDDYIMPLAQTSVTTDSVDGSLYADPSSWTWICPPVDQLSVRHDRGDDGSHRLRNRYAPQPDDGRQSGSDMYPDAVSDISVTVSDGEISVNGSCQAVEGDVDLLLTDALGRVFASATRSVSDGSFSWHIDRSHLPAGEYLFSATVPGSAPATRKIILR